MNNLNDRGETPLYIASKQGVELKVLSLLLSTKLFKLKRFYDELFLGHERIAIILLENGAKTEFSNRNSALNIAADKGNLIQMTPCSFNN